MQDQHRLFVQIMMSRRIVAKAEAKDIIEKDLKASGQTFPHFVALVNDKLDQFSMKLAEARSEENGQSYLGLVNTKENDGSAVLANTYSPVEVEFFVKMLEEILNEAENEGSVPSLRLMNIPSKMDRKMTASQAEQFLQRLENALWIVEDLTGYYVAGPRLLLDLRAFLQSDARVTKCEACADIVLRGEFHTVNGKENKYHLYCAERLFGTEREQTVSGGVHVDPSDV